MVSIITFSGFRLSVPATFRRTLAQSEAKHPEFRRGIDEGPGDGGYQGDARTRPESRRGRTTHRSPAEAFRRALLDRGVAIEDIAFRLEVIAGRPSMERCR